MEAHRDRARHVEIRKVPTGKVLLGTIGWWSLFVSVREKRLCRQTAKRL